MKKYLLVIFLFLTVFAGMAQHGWRPAEMQVLVPLNQPGIDELIEIVKEQHLNTEVAGDAIRCYFTPAELNLVKPSGIQCEIEIADLNQWAASFGERGVPSGYYSVGELNQIADSLAQNFPDICTLHLLGAATGFNQLYALKISDNSAIDEDEPEIMFDGGIHGDEVGGPENMIRFARDLCLQYGSDPQMTRLVDTREIWVYYCVNPYGRLNMTRYNANGVDINRDGGYMWNGEGNSSGACSQPETRVYRNFMAGNQFVIACSYHSGTEFISYPWSYRPDLCPDNAIHNYLASVYASTSGYSGIPYEPGYTGMYAINGSTKDFGYGSLGDISWSIEISLSKQPPASQIVPYYLKNKPAMLAMCENAGYGIHGLVTDSITGLPVAATVFINNYFPFGNDPENGDFHKFLLPGNYQIKVVANGYNTKLVDAVSIASNSVTDVNIALSPSNRYFAKRMLACQIPNNNFNDEGNTPAAIGPPDNVRYSLGRNGFAILEMGEPVDDGDGDDIVVYENDDTPEGYQLLVGTTPDGPWYSLGSATGNHAFDIAASGLQQITYVRIKDDGDGQATVPDAGFDLDAVEGIHRLPAPDSTGFISGIVYDVWNNPASNATVTCGNYTTYSNETGAYTIVADTGMVVICGELWPDVMYDCDSVFVVSADTTYHDLHLLLQESVKSFVKNENQMVVSPNPCTVFTSVTCAGEVLQSQPVIYNATGEPMHCPYSVLDSHTININTSAFKPGLYFVVLKSGSNTVNARLIVVPH